MGDACTTPCIRLERGCGLLLLLLLTANGFSPGGSGTTIRQQTNNTLTTASHSGRLNANIPNRNILTQFLMSEISITS
jgi:hypothetical protein